MKNITLLILLFSICISSQEVQQVEVLKNDNQITDLFDELGQNELKLDLADMLGFPAFDINYERIKDPYSSFGVSLFLNVSNNDSASRNWTDKFTLSPFYRFYFFNKKDYGGAGFFAEIFTKFSFGKNDVEYYNFNPDPNNPGIDYWETIEENFFDIAPGAGIGQKWLNKKGWTFEINVGVGRYLLNKDFNTDSSGQEVNYLRPVAAFKGGLFIGKRF
tara:strand:- start:469 stop:1122 length:654 start_codon:yes stop_codon:yes gene_type:complete